MEKAEPILLGQVIQRMINSERLLIVDESGKELYRGFVGNFGYSALDAAALVKKIQLETNTFRRGNPSDKIPQKEKQVVPVENLTAYSFSDLEFVIYQRITLERST